MYEINEGVVFVQGALNGAIYDFNTNKVFSINDVACEIVNKLIGDKFPLTDDEKNYASQLQEANLYNEDFIIKEYTPELDDSIKLSMAWLEITQSCNLRCLHCYQGNIHVGGNNDLSLSEWKRVIDELINIIIEHDIKIKVSLYGHNAEIHDAITGQKGSFDKLIKNITLLKNRGVTVDIAVVAMKENQEYLEEIESLIKSLGVVYRGYDVIRNVFGGSQSEHTPDKKDVIAKAKHSKPQFITAKSQFDANINRNSCWYGKFAITENGDIIPCVFERNIVYGNVKNNSLSEFLSSNQLKDNWFKDFSKIQVCRDCEFRFACRDCRPLGISVNGNINEKNPRCLYNPYKGEWQK